uniref:CSON010459 protein n=1 Tax=Culicoides sonorensis TaxID=179676 RepID=A0A336N3H1_CULSO
MFTFISITFSDKVKNWRGSTAEGSLVVVMWADLIWTRWIDGAKVVLIFVEIQNPDNLIRNKSTAGVENLTKNKISVPNDLSLIIIAFCEFGLQSTKCKIHNSMFVVFMF